MPEYLSPGVYIEEVPARLKAIEGVSTSTAGMVGRAERGPVAGFAAPFAPATGPVLRLDESPTLVTSFGDFARIFGAPADDPASGGYLAHAARAFFDNGGKRLYVARVVEAGAGYASITLQQGARLRLARRLTNGDLTLYFTSVRGLTAGTLALLRASDGTTAASGTIATIDTVASSVTLTAALTLTAPIEPNAVYVEPSTVAFSTTGPTFYARNPGAWGDALRVQIANADRPAVALTQAVVVNDPVVAVQQTSSFYPGAIVELSNSTTKQYVVCTRVGPGSNIELAALATAPLPLVGAFARVLEIDVIITDTRTGVNETHRGLSWNSAADPDVQRRHYATVLNARSRLVYVEPPATETADLDGQPITANAFESSAPTTPGNNGGTPGDADYVGLDTGPGTRTGIQALQDIEDLRVIGCPESTNRAVQDALLTQCGRMRYRFAVLDAPEAPGAPVVNELLAHRNAHDSSFGAYYAPWVEVSIRDRIVRLPPSGHVMGIYARTDNDRGVWKAPANEVVRGIVGLSSYITTGEQDILNPRGVNAIRRFEGQGTRVWGARTLSSDPEFRYVNVRRFLIFLEASIDRATQWVVFEPNSPPTWARVVNSVTAFLHTQWRGGALLGRTPEDAFYVRCDESTMTADDVQNGRLICDIGVAIVRPAEFVIFRIEQLTGFESN
jgi:uncharacterized protein